LPRPTGCGCLVDTLVTGCGCLVDTLVTGCGRLVDTLAMRLIASYWLRMACGCPRDRLRMPCRYTCDATCDAACERMPRGCGCLVDTLVTTGCGCLVDTLVLRLATPCWLRMPCRYTCDATCDRMPRGCGCLVDTSKFGNMKSYEDGVNRETYCKSSPGPLWAGRKLKYQGKARQTSDPKGSRNNNPKHGLNKGVPPPRDWLLLTLSKIHQRLVKI